MIFLYNNRLLFKVQTSSRNTLKLIRLSTPYSVVLPVIVCLSVLTPQKLLGVRTSNLAQLIVFPSECHKGLDDVVMKDNFSI